MPYVNVKIVCTAAFLVCLSLAIGLESSWTKHEGHFATFMSPAAMTRDTSRLAVDSIQERYISPDLDFCFDSETRFLPPVVQKHLERAIRVWTLQQKAKWDQHFYVHDDAKKTVASVYASFDRKTDPNKPYYLYFGFSTGGGAFTLHFSFHSMDSLEDIESILKSIALKTNKDG